MLSPEERIFIDKSSHVIPFLSILLHTYALIIGFPEGRPPGHPRDFVFKIKQKPTKAPGYGAEMHDKCLSPKSRPNWMKLTFTHKIVEAICH